VAVLYFANRSGDSADVYVADGLTEEIIARLARVERVEVRSHIAVERFRRTSAPPDSLGRALRVAYLVSGAVQRFGRRLRVSAELVHAGSGVTAWAGQFESSDGDLLNIQAAIADTVAQEVAGRLVPRERGLLTARPTRNPEAYDRFLHGNYSLGRRTAEDVHLAIRDYEDALRLDPSFAAAHARIALALGVALDWGWPGFDVRESIRRGLAASARALELDSTLPDAWTARGYILRFANARTYAGVREAFQRAIALAPRDAEAHLQFGWALAALGDSPAAIVTLQRAVTLDPARAVSRYTIAWVMHSAGRDREGIVWLDSGIAQDPVAANLHVMRAWLRIAVGDTAGARDDLRNERTGDQREVGAVQAELEARVGDSTASRATCERHASEWPPAPAALAWGAAWTALACAQTGQAARALDLLERIEPQGLAVWWVAISPDFGPIRSDPRFARFVAELAPPGAH
jgi:adenylate cyclase